MQANKAYLSGSYHSYGYRRASSQTLRGYQYFVTFTDIYIQMTVVHIMKDRKETKGVLIKNINKLKPHFGTKVSKIRNKNSNEYLTNLLLKHFGQEATEISPTVAHSQQENAVAER